MIYTYRQNEIHLLKEQIVKWDEKHEDHSLVGMTSGFYSLGPLKGHLLLLEEAKLWCRFLVVVVNGTKSTIVKYGREYISIEDRLYMLSQNSNVDAVIEYDTVDMCKALDDIRPDIFFKGGSDRRLDNNTISQKEIDKCKLIGCMIKDGCGGFDKNSSTSKLIKEIFVNEYKKNLIQIG